MMRRFCFPFFRAEGDPLPPSSGDSAPAPEPTRTRRAACEFCECTLTERGEVLKISDKARTFRNQEETIARLEREKAQLASDLAELKTKLAAATPARVPTRVAVVGG